MDIHLNTDFAYLIVNKAALMRYSTVIYDGESGFSLDRVKKKYYSDDFLLWVEMKRSLASKPEV